MFALALTLVINWGTFTPNLDPSAPEAARDKAVLRIVRFAAHPKSLAALPALETIARTDPASGVRSSAVFAIGRIAKAHQKPCPQVLFDALTDPDRESAVWMSAQFALDDLKPLPPGSTAKLLKVATTGDADQRDLGYSLLATHAPKDPAALKVLRDAANAAGVLKRHNARCYLFRATDKMSDLFPHIMDLYALRADTPNAPDNAPEDVKRDDITLSMMYLGGAMKLAQWTQDRPGEMLDEMLAAMQQGSPSVRLEVLRQAERFADALAELEPKPDPGAELDPLRMRAGMKAIMTDPAMRLALKTAAEKDPHPALRELAKDIVKKLSP